MARSSRASARRAVLDHLASVKRQVAALQGWWDVTGRIYVDPADRDDPAQYMRERKADEYPEAQRPYWIATIKQIDHITAELERLRKHALNEYHATPEE